MAKTKLTKEQKKALKAFKDMMEVANFYSILMSLKDFGKNRLIVVDKNDLGNVGYAMIPKDKGEN